MVSKMMNKKIPYDEFKYVDSDLHIELPALVLGVRHRHPDWYEEYKFKGDFWQKLCHQTCGHACHHIHMTARVLTPTPEMHDLMKDIADHWYYSDVGVFGTSLNDILIYRTQLQRLGLDCNREYPDFEEAVYPIDSSVDVVRRICQNDIDVEDFDDWIEFGDGLEKFCGMIGRWQLMIWGPNCD